MSVLLYPRKRIVRKIAPATARSGARTPAPLRTGEEGEDIWWPVMNPRLACFLRWPTPMCPGVGSPIRPLRAIITCAFTKLNCSASSLYFGARVWFHVYGSFLSGPPERISQVQPPITMAALLLDRMTTLTEQTTTNWLPEGYRACMMRQMPPRKPPRLTRHQFVCVCHPPTPMRPTRIVDHIAFSLDQLSPIITIAEPVSSTFYTLSSKS